MPLVMEPPVGDVDVLDIDPYTKESLSDPSGYTTAIRDAGRAVWVPQYRMWAVARFEHVKAGLENWKVFVSGFGTALNDARRATLWRPPSLLLDTDPPDHERYRAVLAPAVAGFRSRRPALEALAVELVDRVVAQGRFDAVADFARPYIVRAFGDAVGVPREGREHLLAYADLAFNSFGPDNWLTIESRKPGLPAVEWVTQACKRAHLTPGSMGAMAFDAVDAGKITEEEAERLIRSFFTAGLDSTIATIAHMLRRLSGAADQWAQVHADPALVKNAFEETLRIDSTAPIVYRCVDADIDFAGAQMRKGDKLMFSLFGANHDPAQFEDPLRYDIRRKTPSVGFGFGIHTCIGQMIARTEAEVLLTVFARRVAQLRSAGEPVLHLNNAVRGYTSVPVAVVAA